MEDITIYSYTRAQAIEDGVLIDVTGEAAAFGFLLPVVVTAGVWAEAIEGAVSEADRKAGTAAQVEFKARAKVLQVFTDAVRVAVQAARHGQTTNEVRFEVEVKGRPVKMWGHIGPGDQGEAVVTVMLEGED